MVKKIQENKNIAFATVYWRRLNADIIDVRYIPVSTQFDDVYYSVKNAVGESAFNFSDGCYIKRNFSGGGDIHIVETGFGTGLNFILTLANFFSMDYKNSTLHYWTVEKYPLKNNDMDKALKSAFKNNYDLGIAFSEIENYIDTIISVLPNKPSSGWHTVVLFNNKVYFSIYYGDVLDFVEDKLLKRDSLDCLYLDGFSPSKNSDMWQQSVLQGLYNKCKKGGRFATFTSATSVRVGLQQVGFSVKKTKGFGGKRERLVGIKI